MDIISIHAPREGRDSVVAVASAVDQNFNPRAPRGARREVVVESSS